MVHAYPVCIHNKSQNKGGCNPWSFKHSNGIFLNVKTVLKQLSVELSVEPAKHIKNYKLHLKHIPFLKPLLNNKSIYLIYLGVIVALVLLRKSSMSFALLVQPPPYFRCVARGVSSVLCEPHDQ